MPSFGALNDTDACLNMIEGFSTSSTQIIRSFSDVFSVATETHCDAKRSAVVTVSSISGFRDFTSFVEYCFLGKAFHTMARQQRLELPNSHVVEVYPDLNDIDVERDFS